MSEGSQLSWDVRHRAVRAVLDGMPRLDVATAFAIDRTTLFRWVQRYEAEGETGLHRKAGSGRRRKLEELSEEEIRSLVLKGALHFGYETDLWTVGRLRRMITEEFSMELSKNTVWRRLRDAGLTYQKPEREYYEIDEESRKKWMRYEVPKIRRCVKKHRAILYFQDESNVSLTAFLGETWSPCAKNTQDQGDRSSSWRGSHVGHQWKGTFDFSPRRQTNRIRRSNRVSSPDAQAPSAPPPSRRDGPSSTAYV